MSLLWFLIHVADSLSFSFFRIVHLFPKLLLVQPKKLNIIWILLNQPHGCDSIGSSDEITFNHSVGRVKARIHITLRLCYSHGVKISTVEDHISITEIFVSCFKAALLCSFRYITANFIFLPISLLKTSENRQIERFLAWSKDSLSLFEGKEQLCQEDLPTFKIPCFIVLYIVEKLWELNSGKSPPETREQN